MNRHDKKLDRYLGQKVKIHFTDGDVKTGVLGWNGAFNLDLPIHPYTYYLEYENSEGLLEYLTFRKSCVKKIEKGE